MEGGLAGWVAGLLRGIQQFEISPLVGAMNTNQRKLPKRDIFRHFSVCLRDERQPEKGQEGNVLTFLWVFTRRALTRERLRHMVRLFFVCLHDKHQPEKGSEGYIDLYIYRPFSSCLHHENTNPRKMFGARSTVVADAVLYPRNLRWKQVDLPGEVLNLDKPAAKESRRD